MFQEEKYEKEKKLVINLETSSTNHWTNSPNIHHFELEISKQNKKKIESFFLKFFFIFFFHSFLLLIRFSGSLDNEVASHIMLSTKKQKRVMKYRRKKQKNWTDNKINKKSWILRLFWSQTEYGLEPVMNNF
jgi:hypothetical protein